MDNKYKWGKLYWSTDGACWGAGCDLARGGKPTGEKIVYHTKYAVLPDVICDCDIEYEVYKFTNEDLIMEFDNVKKPFEIYVGKAYLDGKGYKFSNGKKLYGTFIIQDEISMNRFCNIDTINHSV